MSATTYQRPGDLATASRRAAVLPLKARGPIRLAAIFRCPMVIVAALSFLYGRGTLNQPPFVHQGF